MVDNFQHIATLMDSRNPGPDDMFMVQTIRRRKENPEQESNNRTIKVRYLANGTELLKYRDEIIAECKAHNARAYINLNRRSKKKVALESLALMARIIANGQFDVRNTYDSAAGSNCSEPEKLWVVDIDFKDLDEKGYGSGFYPILTYIISLVEETERTPLHHMVPTKNGFHILTRPFNLQKFKEVFSNIDVHKDNPTILYVP